MGTWGKLSIGLIGFALICSAAEPIDRSVREATGREIETKIAAVKTGIENGSALASFFAALQEGDPVHILQFGDSHTASGAWVNAMRKAAQTRYQDGGPGFVGCCRLRRDGKSLGAMRTRD